MNEFVKIGFTEQDVVRKVGFISMDSEYESIPDTSVYNDKFFIKGDLVKVGRLDLSPTMVVKEVVFDKNKEGEFRYENGSKILRGIRAFWYTKDYIYQEELFNSKDLIKV